MRFQHTKNTYQYGIRKTVAQHTKLIISSYDLAGLCQWKIVSSFGMQWRGMNGTDHILVRALFRLHLLACSRKLLPSQLNVPALDMRRKREARLRKTVRHYHRYTSCRSLGGKLVGAQIVDKTGGLEGIGEDFKTEKLEICIYSSANSQNKRSSLVGKLRSPQSTTCGHTPHYGRPQ